MEESGESQGLMQRGKIGGKKSIKFRNVGLQLFYKYPEDNHMSSIIGFVLS